MIQRSHLEIGSPGVSPALHAPGAVRSWPRGSGRGCFSRSVCPDPARMAGCPRGPLSITHTHTQTGVCTCTPAHTHVCRHTHMPTHSHSTHTHTAAPSVSLVWLTPSHTQHPPALLIPIPISGEASLPLLLGATWAKAHFQRPRRRPPLPCPPRGPRRPSTSAKGPAQQLGRFHHPGCAQSRPRPPEALHDVTRADRRNEQAPRSCRTQGRFPAGRPAKRRCAPRPQSGALDPGPHVAEAPSFGGSRRRGAIP